MKKGGDYSLPRGMVLAQPAGGPGFSQSPRNGKVARITDNHSLKPPVSDSISICTNFPKYAQGGREEGRGGGEGDEEKEEEET